MRVSLCDDCVAGMWRPNLESELLWYVGESQLDRSGSLARPGPYRTLIWPWAAVDGSVKPGLPIIEALDTIIEAEVVRLEYLTDDNTGLIKGGWLQLRGVLKHLTLTPYLDSIIVSYRNWAMRINGVEVCVPPEFFFNEPHVMVDAINNKDFDEQNAKATLCIAC